MPGIFSMDSRGLESVEEDWDHERNGRERKRSCTYQSNHSEWDGVFGKV